MNYPENGRFVTLEGVEGAGKSTVAAALETWLVKRGQRVLRTREPGGTLLAEQLRTLLLQRGPEQINPAAETLLMFAARREHIVAPGAGHYGIFAGRRWRDPIYPKVRDFIRKHA